MAGDLPPKALISRQTKESPAKPFVAATICKMFPIVVVSPFLHGQSENFERKCEDLVSNKFDEPLLSFLLKLQKVFSQNFQKMHSISVL
jgi:hypothetical protein